MSEVLQFGQLGAPVVLAATTSVVAAALPGVGGDSARIMNTGAVQVAIRFATAEQSQTPQAAFNDPNSILINANEDKVVSMPYGATAVGCLASALGPTNVYVQRGSGGT